ncbi:unnamed protein product [Staurois parvus]|uniref:Uncharacterized protein n=1 Tax=Staurois parvus TaxID=386267 RepID=A0ABN9BLZ0_9NEOB|nr:unnamed protein product [Staurois parvus]
MVLALLFLL